MSGESERLHGAELAAAYAHLNAGQRAWHLGQLERHERPMVAALETAAGPYRGHLERSLARLREHQDAIQATPWEGTS